MAPSRLIPAKSSPQLPEKVKILFSKKEQFDEIEPEKIKNSSYLHITQHKLKMKQKINYSAILLDC